MTTTIPLESVAICRTADEQRAAMAAFWDLWRTPPRPRILTFCGRFFDVPYVIQQSSLLGLRVPPLSLDRYRGTDVVDLFDVLTFSDGRSDAAVMKRTLTNFCRVFQLAVPQDDLKGKDVAALVAADTTESWAAVRAHCHADLVKTLALAQLLACLGRIPPLDGVPYVVLDLETAARPDAATYLDPPEPDKRLTDPKKIAADLETKAAAQLDKCALDWNVGRIVALGAYWSDARAASAADALGLF